MALRQIMRGLAGVGARKLGGRLESFFESPFGDALPAAPCACTKWRSSKHGSETGNAMRWDKTCRGPGRTRVTVAVNAPSTDYKRVWEGKPWESGYEWKATRHPAGAEVVVYAATDDTSADVGHAWKLQRRHHIGYFKSPTTARRRADEVAARWCQRALKRG